MRICISSPWWARRDRRWRQKVSQKHSQKIAGGSVFYPARWAALSASSPSQPVSMSARSRLWAFAANVLRGVGSRRRALAERRSLPLLITWWVRQPWRERPPARVRDLAPDPPRRVAHATAAACPSVHPSAIHAAVLHPACIATLHRRFVAASGLELTRKQQRVSRTQGGPVCL
jgi:hypothetical protein